MSKVAMLVWVAKEYRELTFWMAREADKTMPEIVVEAIKEKYERYPPEKKQKIALLMKTNSIIEEILERS